MKAASTNKPREKRPIRVLMLLENAAYSEDGRVRCEANSLAAAGYDVTVIGPAAEGERWFQAIRRRRGLPISAAANGERPFWLFRGVLLTRSQLCLRLPCGSQYGEAST